MSERCELCRTDYIPLPVNDGGICPACLHDIDPTDWKARAEEVEAENKCLQAEIKRLKTFGVLFSAGIAKIFKGKIK
jgi:hypothetical protein